MLVGEVAAQSLAHLREFAKVRHELVAFVEGEQRCAALAVVETPRTARKGREYVEHVHDADLERVAALPRTRTLQTLHIVTTNTSTKATSILLVLLPVSVVFDMHAGDAQGVHVLTSLERARDLERAHCVRSSLSSVVVVGVVACMSSLLLLVLAPSLSLLLLLLRPRRRPQMRREFVKICARGLLLLFHLFHRRHNAIIKT